MKKKSEKNAPEAGAEAEPLAHHDALLRQLSERTRGSDVGVVLSQEEVKALRQLSSMEPTTGASPPARVRKTRELKISEEEHGLLNDLALEQARAIQEDEAPRVRPRRRTTEIQVSGAELEYLRRLSYDQTSPGPLAQVQEQLDAAPREPRRRVTLALTRSEARWLARVAGEHDNALTATERDALRALQQKLSAREPGRDER